LFRHLRTVASHLIATSIARRDVKRDRDEVRENAFALWGEFGKGVKVVELGAFIVIPGREDFTAVHEVQAHVASRFENSRPLCSSRMPIVGNDLLRSWMDRIRQLGVQNLWLTSGRGDGTVTHAELAKFAREGVERLLLIKLNSYAEMDLSDLLRFHCENRNPVTEAHDARGQLGVSLLDLALRAPGEKPERSAASTDCGQVPYQFSGYAKRILAARERQELVGDALTGACAMRPFGTQIREQIWIGEGANLASSVRIIGPTYIGARATIGAGATIGPFAAVESDCVVDCGTTVERSTVLPHTYLAPGLLIQDGVVDGGYMEHLVWGTVADLQPAGLGSRIPRREARRQASCEVPTDGSSPVDRNPGWNFGSSSATSASAASAPWLQVQL
jgi:carbonic anhydrase/acetyltransferase-like protein (isoleucine patch superfamily)